MSQQRIAIHGCRGDLFQSPLKKKQYMKENIVQKYYKKRNLQEHKKDLKDKYFSNISHVYDQEKQVFEMFLEEQQRKNILREQEKDKNSLSPRRNRAHQNSIQLPENGKGLTLLNLQRATSSSYNNQNGFNNNINMSPLVKSKNSITTPQNKLQLTPVTKSQYNDSFYNNLYNNRSNIQNSSNYILLHEGDNNTADYYAKVYERLEQQGVENSQILHYIERLNLKYHTDQQDIRIIESNIKKKMDEKLKLKSYVSPQQEQIMRDQLSKASNYLNNQDKSILNIKERYLDKIRRRKTTVWDQEHKNLPNVMKGDQNGSKEQNEKQEFEKFEKLQKYMDVFSSKQSSKHQIGISSNVTSKLRSISLQIQSNRTNQSQNKSSLKKLQNCNQKIIEQAKMKQKLNNDKLVQAQQRQGVQEWKVNSKKGPVVQGWQTTQTNFMRNIQSVQQDRDKPLSQTVNSMSKKSSLSDIRNANSNKQQQKERSITEFKLLQSQKQQENMVKDFMNQSTNKFLKKLSGKPNIYQNLIRKNSKDVAQANVTIKFIKGLKQQRSQSEFYSTSNKKEKQQIRDNLYKMRQSPISRNIKQNNNKSSNNCIQQNQKQEIRQPSYLQNDFHQINSSVNRDQETTPVRYFNSGYKMSIKRNKINSNNNHINDDQLRQQYNTANNLDEDQNNNLNSQNINKNIDSTQQQNQQQYNDDEFPQQQSTTFQNSINNKKTLIDSIGFQKFKQNNNDSHILNLDFENF